MKKLSFAEGIIVVCLIISLSITAAVVYEYHRLCEVMPAGVVGGLLGLWGGELLIIALRQIFGSDATSNKHKNNYTDEEGI